MLKVTEEELAKDLRRRFHRLPTLVLKSISKAAGRGRTLLARRTPVDMGIMKNAWQAKEWRGHPRIINDAPHAGIIESGARPHRVNKAGIEALTSWARRKLGLSDKEARSAAFAISKKIEKEGQEGKFIVRDSLDELRQITVMVVEREIKKQAEKLL